MKPASKFEIVAARCWNVLYGGEILPSRVRVGDLLSPARLRIGGRRVLGAGAAGAPPHRSDSTRVQLLRLSAKASVGALGIPRGPSAHVPFRDLPILALALGIYVFFTVFFWGTFYYHLRTSAPKINFVRF